MLIIVEGADGVGKTTLVEALQAQVKNVEVLHRGPIKRPPLEEYEYDLDHYRPGSGLDIICDRWHWGEMIYGPLLRGESKLHEAQADHVDRYLTACGALIIYVTGRSDVVRKRMRARGDDLVRDDQVAYLLMQYELMFQRRRILSVVEKYDTTTESIAAVKTFAQQMALRARINERHARDTSGMFGTYVGPTRPTWLLLGDRRNRPTPVAPHRSAFVPYVGTSGLFLSEALRHAAIHQSVGIANSAEENLQELWYALGYPGVVALGNNAVEVCRKWKLASFGAVPHPQYVRRFHSSKLEDYARLIDRAAHDQEDLRKCL